MKRTKKNIIIMRLTKYILLFKQANNDIFLAFFRILNNNKCTIRIFVLTTERQKYIKFEFATISQFIDISIII